MYPRRCGTSCARVHAGRCAGRCSWGYASVGVGNVGSYCYMDLQLYSVSFSFWSKCVHCRYQIILTLCIPSDSNLHLFVSYCLHIFLAKGKMPLAQIVVPVNAGRF